MSLPKRSKIVLGVVLIAAIFGYAVLNYAYKPHQTVDEREVKFTGTVEAFNKIVSTDTSPWQDVVVQLSGTITAIDANGFTLNSTTYCQLSNSEKISTLKTGQYITIKARMIGYDDLLEELKLDKTKIIK